MIYQAPGHLVPAKWWSVIVEGPECAVLARHSRCSLSRTFRLPWAATKLNWVRRRGTCVWQISLLAPVCLRGVFCLAASPSPLFRVHSLVCWLCTRSPPPPIAVSRQRKIKREEKRASSSNMGVWLLCWPWACPPGFLASFSGITNYEEYSLIQETTEDKKEDAMGTLKKDRTLLRDERKMEKLKAKLHTDDDSELEKRTFPQSPPEAWSISW